MKQLLLLATLLLAGCGAAPSSVKPHVAPLVETIAVPHVAAAASHDQALAGETLWQRYPAHAVWATDVAAGREVLVAAFESLDHPFADLAAIPLMTDGSSVAFDARLILTRRGMVYMTRPRTDAYYPLGRYATQDLALVEGSPVKLELSTAATFTTTPAGLAISLEHAPEKAAPPNWVERPLEE